jgi:TRAP-type C4-dicarboxylate transport system permease small subunit
MTGMLKTFTARVLGVLCVLIFAALVADVLWGVATRYIIGRQASWSEELARFLLVWLSMIGAALAYIQHSHLGVDILTRSLDPSARRVARATGQLVVFLFAAAVMVYGGTTLFIERWNAGQVMSALPMRKAWFYLSIPVSGSLITLFALDQLIASVTGKDSDSLAEKKS